MFNIKINLNIYSTKENEMVWCIGKRRHYLHNMHLKALQKKLTQNLFSYSRQITYSFFFLLIVKMFKFCVTLEEKFFFVQEHEKN